MSVQDKLEGVLREIHILFANSKKYANSDDMIVVEKSKVFALLNELNVHVYEMMDEHEVTQQSKEKARRDAQFRGEKLVREAEKNAEDVYAASVMYSYEALHQVQSVIDKANVAMEELLRDTQESLSSQKAIIRENQSELQEQLQDMADARTYFKLIQENNREIERRKKEIEDAKAQADGTKDKGKKGRSLKSAGVKPEIKINPGYFEKAGLSMEKVYGKEEDDKPLVVEKPEIKVNMDAEYFKRKQAEQEKKEEVEEQDEVTKSDDDMEPMDLEESADGVDKQQPATQDNSEKNKVRSTQIKGNGISDVADQRKAVLKAGIRETLGKIKKELVNAELPQPDSEEVEDELRLDQTELGKFVKRIKDEE